MTKTLELTAAAREFLIEHVYNYEDAERRWPETLPQNAECFTTLAQLKRQVTASGSHWFTAGTMDYWNSRIAPRLVGSRFFISSERMDDRSPRLYKVRWVVGDEAGGRLSIYNFEDVFDSLDKAKRFAKTAHALIPFSPGE